MNIIIYTMCAKSSKSLRICEVSSYQQQMDMLDANEKTLNYKIIEDTFNSTFKFPCCCMHTKHLATVYTNY